MNETRLVFTTVSVAVVCMSGVQHLTRCIESLRRQRGAPEFEIVVACAPRLPDIEATRQRFPEARIVINDGQRTPLELASRAVRECRGELILLTKDHCVPSPDWVRAMVDAQCKGRAVVGGRVEIGPDASTTEWAYFFVDFFRYAGPVAAGPTPFLTVCNVAYKRDELDTIRKLWEETFVETVINDALRARFGTLWLTPASEVTMYRHITLRDAIHERYAFGRLFGYSRVTRWSLARRLVYALGAPVLPFLLLGRMAGVAFGSRRNGRAFMRSLAPLALMVLARCWGEWLAYLTGHYPRSLEGRRNVVRSESVIVKTTERKRRDRESGVSSGVAQTGRMAFVDPLRCVAFLSVFAQHVFIDEIARLARSQDTAVASVFGAVYRFVRIEGAPGVFGVVLFFVISGYCIAKAARRETPAQFAVRRAFRVYPLLVVALALEVLLMRVEGGALPAARALLGSVTLTGDFLNVRPRLAGVEWTLRLELLFYATIGLGLVLVTRRPMLRIVVPTVWRYAAILAVIALLPAFPAAMWTRGYVNLFAPFFVIGAAFAAYERGHLARASLVLVVLASFGVSLWTQHAFRPDYGRFAGYYLAALALFAGGWWLRNRMGGSRIVYLLSLLTYATYLFHAFLVRAFERGLERLLPGGSELVLGTISPNKLGAIALFFVVMGALVALVEQPLIRWSKRLA